MKRIIISISILASMMSSCGNQKNDTDATGVFESTEVTVSALVAGEIVAFDVEEGYELRMNQQVGCIDTTQLYLKRKQMMASLSSTDARRLNESQQLAAIRQQIANAEAERKRFEELKELNAATEKQVDDINYQIAVLKQQETATKEQIASSNQSISGQSQSILAQIEQIDDMMRQAKIKSPAEGVVINKYAERGEYAAPGKPLFKVADIRNMKLRAYISAEQLTWLKLGQKVTVYADQGEEERKAYEGKVIWISPKAEFTPKTIQTRDERSNLVYAVKIAVMNDGLIKTGMYGEVSFGSDTSDKND